MPYFHKSELEKREGEKKGKRKTVRGKTSGEEGKRGCRGGGGGGGRAFWREAVGLNKAGIDVLNTAAGVS